jgi:hypothetical protein
VWLRYRGGLPLQPLHLQELQLLAHWRRTPGETPGVHCFQGSSPEAPHFPLIVGDCNAGAECAGIGAIHARHVDASSAETRGAKAESGCLKTESC